MTDNDWRKWKNGKYDNRYHKVKRHSGQTNYLKTLAIVIPISIIVIILILISNQGIADFMSKNLANLPSSFNVNSITNNPLKTIPNKILTEDNYFAQLVPSNVQVVEKDKYNVIIFTVNVNVQDLPFDGNVFFEDLYTTLQDQNSKTYHPDSAECSLNDLIPIIGKQGNSVSYNVCYSVDKGLKTFSIYYTEPPNNYHSYRLGHLSVDSGLFDYYKSHYTSQPIQIGIIDLINK